MKLIAEQSEDVKCTIVEGTGDKPKQHFIEGIFIQAEQPNHNRRIYPKAVLDTAVDNYVEDYVSKSRAVGELNYPEGPGINLDKVSHRITSLKWKGNDVIGKALVLDTPMGKIVKGLLEGGCQLGVSTRGMGTVSEAKNGISIINEGFRLNTVDIVQDPSAPSAFVDGIMEGIEYFYEGNEWVAKKATELKHKYTRMSTQSIVEAQVKDFADFLSAIK
jgi:hypothetical protein